MVNSDKIQLFSDIDRPYGATFGAWTVKWWQWLLSIPLDMNPLTDQTGRYWNSAQPLSDVWFLAGNFGSTNRIFPERKIKMQFGRSILLPVLNCEANTLEYPDLKTHEDLLRHVSHDVNTIVKKDCFVNGIRLNPIRITSDPRIFRVSINKENAFGVKNGGSTDATADGYWIFLKPLPRGVYTIRFEGSCEFGRLNSGAVYEIEIDW
jgi:hypothetical protein